MISKKLKFPLLLLLALAYSWLFWQESIGINLLIFSVAVLGGVWLLNPKMWRSWPVRITAAGSLLTGFWVVFHNSQLAIWVHIISFLLFAGFSQQTSMRALLSAGTGIIVNYVFAIGELVKAPLRGLGLVSKEGGKSKRGKKVFSVIKLVTIPLLILIVFVVIFQFANPRFEQYLNEVLTVVGSALERIFGNLSWGWIFFFISGVLILSGLLINAGKEYIAKWDARHSDFIVRERLRGIKKFAFHGLQKENKIGVITLIMVNLLLLGVNAIDISWVWIGFEIPEGFDLKQFVHEGTYLLILSILLSMGIMLWFFRKNQNFNPKNKWLKWGSYVWIVQNCILVGSVAMRNYHYIDFHGLAYKRIGVIFFLVMTLFGLVTLFIKIRNQKSFYYLLRMNGWALYGTLVLMTCINWDPVIAEHNLSHAQDKDIDMPFQVTLSDATLPILIEYADQFDTNSTESQRLESRVDAFLTFYPKHSWKSWNLAEAKAYRKVKALQKE